MSNFWFTINWHLQCALEIKNKKALVGVYFLPVSFSSLILPQEPICLGPFHFNSIGCKLIFWETKSIPERCYMSSILLLFSSLGLKKKTELMKLVVIIFLSCIFFRSRYEFFSSVFFFNSQVSQLLKWTSTRTPMCSSWHIQMMW